MKYFWFKIKHNIQINNLRKNIFRCVFTNIDPETAKRNADGEPLKTLKTYRVFEHLEDKTPVLGIHLGVRVKGIVQLGDGVYVGDYN